MTTEQRLTLLKQNLQLLTDANDTLLTHLLDSAEASMQREGIINDDSPDYEACVVDYAAYLFRRRASDETTMPRFLRWNMNNILFSQKAREVEP